MDVSKKTFSQFFRYVFAGGFAFVVDFSVLVACRELVFKNCSYGVYISVVIAFIAGHVTNYVLSLWLVFTGIEERRQGLTLKAFMLFALCAFGGMMVTELGMWIGYGIAHLHYISVKAVMAAVVFTLNFIGRKMIVSR